MSMAAESIPTILFYGGFSPRVAGAWSSKFTDGVLSKLLPAGKTVIRGGYNRIYARMNGINLVQVPLQGTGIGQPVSCIGASRTGQCLGSAGVDPPTAFRIGTDGLSAPFPPFRRLCRSRSLPRCAAMPPPGHL